MAYNNVYRALRGMIKRNTAKAILFVVVDPETGKELEEWLPTSQIQSTTPLMDGSGQAIVMASEWILRQKGWMHLPTAPVPTAAAFGNISAPAPTAPPLPSRPPAKSFVDMDDDIPF